jgi:hypothetical protein
MLNDKTKKKISFKEKKNPRKPSKLEQRSQTRNKEQQLKRFKKIRVI